MVAVKTYLDVYQVPCDIEDNCRLHNIDEFGTFSGWMSKNRLTVDGDQMSYHYDIRGPDDQVFEYIPVFDPDKRPGGYASFHRLKVDPHAAGSGHTFGKKRVLCTSLDPFPQPLDVWE